MKDSTKALIFEHLKCVQAGQVRIESGLDEVIRRIGNLEILVDNSMPSKTISDVVSAHKHSSSHRDQILAGQTCGCFHCLQAFSPKKITGWVDWPAGTAEDEELDFGTTALCPFCGIDSVIGDTSGFHITQDFLKKMNQYWFAQ